MCGVHVQSETATARATGNTVASVACSSLVAQCDDDYDDGDARPSPNDGDVKCNVDGYLVREEIGV